MADAWKAGDLCRLMVIEKEGVAGEISTLNLTGNNNHTQRHWRATQLRGALFYNQE
jgi:hypothetical protein